MLNSSGSDKRIVTRPAAARSAVTSRPALVTRSPQDALRRSDKRRETRDEFRLRCRKAGLKVTPQRVAVYKALIESGEHPSADMLWRRVRKTYPNISLDTVNRGLLTLAEIGAAFIVEGSGGVRRFDGRLEAHQHFKCIKCKKIIDFHHKPFDNIPVPKSISRKYTVLKKTVYFEGICDLCRNRKSKIKMQKSK